MMDNMKPLLIVYSQFSVTWKNVIKKRRLDKFREWSIEARKARKELD